MNEHRLDHDLTGQAATRLCECDRACVHVEIGDLRLKFSPEQFLAFTESLIDDYCRVLVRRTLSGVGEDSTWLPRPTDGRIPEAWPVM